MKGVFKKHRGKDPRTGKKLLSQKWYVEFRDHLERVHRTPAFKDRSASDEYLRQLRRLVDVRTNNLAIPSDVLEWLRNLQPAYVERIVTQFGLLDRRWLAATESLTAHVEAFCESLEEKDRTSEHVDLYRFRVERLLREAVADRWNQLTPETVRKAWRGLKTRSGKPLAQGTRNHYLVAFKSFCGWMVKTGRATSNPCQGVDPVKVTERRERKPLSVAELDWLLSQTEAGPVRRDKARDGTFHFELTGSERSLLYMCAVETGLRLGELRALRVCDFDLAGTRPVVRLHARDSKNRKEPPPLPLREALAERLRSQFAQKLPQALAFNAPDRLRAAGMLRADLEFARAEWIKAGATPEDRAKRARSDFLEPVDHSGRVVDFHALRTTTASWLAEAGVSPYVMQQIMRHSDIKTTMAHYAKLRPDVTRAALEQMPPLRLTDAG